MTQDRFAIKQVPSAFKARLEEIVKGLSYKDWTIEVTSSWYGQIKVYPPNAVVPDTYGRRSFIQSFYDYVPVAERMTDAEIKRAILVRILALEEHEIFEWFKDGEKPVMSPHMRNDNTALSHFKRRDYYETLIKDVARG